MGQTHAKVCSVKHTGVLHTCLYLHTGKCGQWQPDGQVRTTMYVLGAMVALAHTIMA